MNDRDILPASLPPERVAATYSRRAPYYDAWANLFERRAHARALELAAPGGAERALMVAVGTGADFAALLRRNERGWNEGLDISPGMLALAQRRAQATGVRSFRLVRADARRLPYASASFDLLLCSYLLDLLPTADLLPVLAELRRVLAPGGRLVLTNMAPGRGLAGWFWQAFYGTPLSPSADCRPLPAAALAEAAGFRIHHRELLVERSFSSEIIVATVYGGASVPA
jgi:ubiquinone/menaquinone biosynthesis C-methylase UbiE